MRNYLKLDMNTKIQELTDIIYNEGVVKGQQEADKVLADANAQAEEILAKAKAEAASIISDAEKKALQDSETCKKELKLFASQAIESLKSEITDILSDKISKDSASNLISDKSFINQFVLNLASEWSKNESIVISSSDAESLKSFFASKAKELLDSGVKIEKINGKTAGFTVSPANGAYKIQFGQEQFENFFKSILRPQLVESLF